MICIPRIKSASQGLKGKNGRHFAAILSRSVPRWVVRGSFYFVGDQVSRTDLLCIPLSLDIKVLLLTYPIFICGGFLPDSKESAVGWLRFAIFWNCAWGRDFQFPFTQNLPRVPENLKHDPTFTNYLNNPSLPIIQLFIPPHSNNLTTFQLPFTTSIKLTNRTSIHT